MGQSMEKMISIDLRSDTLTKPTNAMRSAMYSSAVGDDVYEEDPTVQKLEARVATMFGKESALFFPSGTMSNLTAVLSWCPGRGGEVIVGDNSHMFLYEQAGMAQFGGVSPRTVKNASDGTLPLDEVHLAIREDDIHEPATKLICIENTHNACGGVVLPLSYMRDLKEVASKYSLPVHLDGARIWNAIEASKVDPAEIGATVDSLSVCLSKGLGAPVGSLLVGPLSLILKARRIRKALGGGMRQSGVLAAPGLIALDDFEKGILKEDHRKAKMLANAIRDLRGFHLREPVETNILFIETGETSAFISQLFRERGIRVSAWAPHLIRVVIHRDIDTVHMEKIVNAFTEVSEFLA